MKWLLIVTLCGVYTNLRYAYAQISAYLSLLLQHFAFLLSAQLTVAGGWEIEAVALVQHPHQFPLPLSKRSENKQNDHDKRLNSSL